MGVRRALVTTFFACLAFAAVAVAVPDRTATLGVGATTYTWTGTKATGIHAGYVGTQAEPCTKTVAAYCDDTLLRVAVPSDVTAALAVAITGDADDDFDVYLYRADAQGEPVPPQLDFSNSPEPGARESVGIGPARGDYVLRVVYYSVDDDDYLGEARLLNVPDAQASPTPTPTPSPTPTPAASPTPEPSVTPEASPTPSPSPQPEVSPSPAPEVSPTAEPQVSPTPVPATTATPAPAATPTQAPAATGTPSPLRLSIVRTTRRGVVARLRCGQTCRSRTELRDARGRRLGSRTVRVRGTDSVEFVIQARRARRGQVVVVTARVGSEVLRAAGRLR